MFLRTLLILGRVSNLPTVWTNVMAATFLAGGTWRMELAWAMAGGSLLYIGGMAMNDAFDAAWDREHGKDRPIAQGKIQARTVWIFSGICMLLGAGMFIGLAGAVWWWVLALILAIVAYNAVHKKTEESIWLMGACRLLLFVAAASTVMPMPDRMVWFWGMALLAYVAGVTLAARGENTGGAIKVLAPVLLGVPVVLGILLLSSGDGDWRIRSGVVAILFFWLVMSYLQLHRSKSIGAFVSSLLAGMVLVDAVAVSSVSLFAASVCAAALPLNRLLQRFVPAT